MISETTDLNCQRTQLPNGTAESEVPTALRDRRCDPAAPAAEPRRDAKDRSDSAPRSRSRSDEGHQATGQSTVSFLEKHDGLTGLPNHSLCTERLREAMARCDPDRLTALVYVDIDQFRIIADTMGASTAGRALKVVARRLVSCVRGRDTVARVGPDEFALVLRDLPSADCARVSVERILFKLAAPCEIDGVRVELNASAGVALTPGDGSDPETVYRHAEMALRQLRSEQRFGHRFFAPEMDQVLQNRRMIEGALRGALENHEFDVAYQPLCDARTGRINAFEALLRWRHNEQMIGPDQFIPIAEEAGLITAIGEWILREACIEAARWPDEIGVAVNVSLAQLTSAGLVDSVRRALHESGLAASRLELEITEAALMQKSDVTMDVLNEIRSLGVHISIDDFGTGHSSLSHLRCLPVDKIKIDRSFVRAVTEAKGASAIIRAIAGLGTAMGLETTAEGVETAEQLAAVRAGGCTEVQGYLFSRPIPATEVHAMLAAGASFESAA